jgi:hypothetical protein
MAEIDGNSNFVYQIDENDHSKLIGGLRWHRKADQHYRFKNSTI